MWGTQQSFAVQVDAADMTVPVVIVHGDIDVATAPELEECLAELLTRHPERLIIDLTDTTLIDCAGARVIVAARRQLPAEDCQVILRGPRPLARRVLEITGLDGPCVIED